MFTGIVEETGIVKQIKQGDKSIELAITAKLCAQDMQVGGSLAINGCCLTLVRKSVCKSRLSGQFRAAFESQC